MNVIPVFRREPATREGEATLGCGRGVLRRLPLFLVEPGDFEAHDLWLGIGPDVDPDLVLAAPYP